MTSISSMSGAKRSSNGFISVTAGIAPALPQPSFPIARVRPCVMSAKVFGLSDDAISALAGMVWGTHAGGVPPDRHVRGAGLDPSDRTLAKVMELAQQLMGFPRHLSQHVGGFVLTRGPLVEVVPVGNAAMADRTFIEWDKDDIAALKLMKVDVLALGMLTCVRKAFDLIKKHHGKTYTLATVPRG